MISFDPAQSRGVGSCSTLVTQVLQQASPLPSLGECCLLLEGAVLLDTMNLQFSFKTTPEDVAAVEWLESHRMHDRPPREELYGTLCDAKYDPVFWSSLSLQDAFAIDYKLFVMGLYRIGWSVVLCPIKSLEGKAAYRKEVDLFVKKEKIDALLVTSLVKGEVVRRELEMYCSNDCPSELRAKVDQIEHLMETAYHCSRDLENPHLLQTTCAFSRKSLAQELVQLFDSFDCLKQRFFSLYHWMSFDTVKESTRAVEYIDRLKSILSTAGRTDVVFSRDCDRIVGK